MADVERIEGVAQMEEEHAEQNRGDHDIEGDAQLDDERHAVGRHHGREEQAVFEELITVKGIGPKLALGILSGMNAADLMDAIVRQDVLRLSGVPGIGKKTAERIVLELRDRVNKKRDGISLPAGLPGSTLAREAIAALEALGYKRNSVDSTVSAIMRSDNAPDSVSDLIKRALKEMQ